MVANQDGSLLVGSPTPATSSNPATPSLTTCPAQSRLARAQPVTSKRRRGRPYLGSKLHHVNQADRLSIVTPRLSRFACLRKFK
jgi:hypothetical protein